MPVPAPSSTTPRPLPAPRVAWRLAALSAVGLLALGCSTGTDDDTSTTAAPPTTTTGGETTTTTEVSLAPLDDRPIDVHVPPSYDPDTPAPLLVLLHGYGANGAIQSAYLALEPEVDERGMLYVYPDGTENEQGSRYWNATEACCAGPDSEVDDVAYLSAIIARVQADHNVDPDRIFLVGHSNGGFMSFRMACERADAIAAIVSLEGATFAERADCTPSEPVATLQVHGTADETIRYEGDDIGGRRYPSAEATLEMWADNNGCDPEPDEPAPPPRSVVADLEPATVRAHRTGCDPGGASELWTQPGGIHIPIWSETFAAQLLDWLLEHPKP